MRPFSRTFFVASVGALSTTFGCGQANLDSTPSVHGALEVLSSSDAQPAPTETVMWELKHGGVPPARTHHAAAYDGARGKLVLFGGLATSDLDDTWEWDGRFWKQIFPATKPSARKYHLLVYDSARGHVLLYGGEGNGSVLGDLWAWDGENWTQLNPATQPASRKYPAGTFDATLERFVLHGGWDSTGFLDDTWEWDGSA